MEEKLSDVLEHGPRPLNAPVSLCYFKVDHTAMYSFFSTGLDNFVNHVFY